MHTRIFSATVVGVEAHSVSVEVDLSLGMLQFFIVGLPDIAIKESKQRITTALKNSGMRFPDRKITVNLAPADLKKEGTLFDLPIAVGILQANNYLSVTATFLQETLFLGELSLDGTIRPVKGVLAIASDMARLGKKRIILPYENAQEAALIDSIEVIGVRSIVELAAHLRNEMVIAHAQKDTSLFAHFIDQELDFAQVKGQEYAKRALMIAAAGGHNILFMGSPGAGKTMLAKRLPSIMPPMQFDQMIQTSKIYSVTGKLREKKLVWQRPFRNPHHTISQAGLVGGGSFPQPGEISLAHNGILFLDELTEFKRETLEVLRQPLESRSVSLARANHTVTYPASFLLVAALNPCPCGFLGDTKKQCICSPTHVSKYLKKLSGPLLDRIDLQISVQSIEYEATQRTAPETMHSAHMREQVLKAVAIQEQRFALRGLTNSMMHGDDIERYCSTDATAQALIKKIFDTTHMSMRSYHKMLKVARTIADLDNAPMIDVRHIKEAFFYRSIDQHAYTKI